MRCFCSCIWGNPDPGPVRLRDVQQVVLDTSKRGEPMMTSSPLHVCSVYHVWNLNLSINSMCEAVGLHTQFVYKLIVLG